MRDAVTVIGTRKFQGAGGEERQYSGSQPADRCDQAVPPAEPRHQFSRHHQSYFVEKPADVLGGQARPEVRVNRDVGSAKSIFKLPEQSTQQLWASALDSWS